jgi:hypothetical protein
MTVRRLFSRRRGVLGLVAAAVVVVGAVMAAAQGASAAPRFGWVRLAHLSPDTPPVDVYLYSFGNPKAMVTLRHVAYGEVSPYERVAAGEYTVAMRNAGARATSKPVVSATVDVMAGGAYTVAGLGPASALRLQVLHDRLTTPKGKALVRVIQASLRQPRVTVQLGGRVLARALRFGSFTGYRAVRPGLVTVRAGDRAVHATAAEHLSASGVYTIVILDARGRLAIDCLMEAAGSRVMPAGAAPMGLGGTAARPGWPLLPWAITGAAGLAAAAGGYARIRRPRRPPAHAR